MKKFKAILNFILGLVLIGVLGWGLYLIIGLLFRSLSSLNPNVSAAIIAAFATVTVSTLTLAISKQYQLNADRFASNRENKVILYSKIIDQLYDVLTGGNKGLPKDPGQTELVQFFKDIQRDLIIWGGPKTIIALVKWRREILKSKDSVKQYMALMDFFLSLREDLGHSNKSLNNTVFTELLLKNSALLISEYKKNPNITFADIVVLEQRLGLNS